MNRRTAVLINLAAAFFAGLPAHAQMTSREFHTDLSAWNQTRLTESDAVGTADLELDLTTLTLTWNVSFTGLVSRPIAASLHGPAQPGANGLPFVDLAPNGIVSPLKGSAVVTEAEVQYLLAGWTYVNITTERWPYGEIRGQVDVGPRN
ncbi:MAG: CHRD domain-containing protein [Rhodospirillaceae bacterium]